MVFFKSKTDRREAFPHDMNEICPSVRLSSPTLFLPRATESEIEGDNCKREETVIGRKKEPRCGDGGQGEAPPVESRAPVEEMRGRIGGSEERWRR